MILNELKERFEKNEEIKFKLFSLEYIIKKIDNQVMVYAIMYPNRKSYYSNIDDPLNNFTIYNESVLDNINRVLLLSE